MPRTTLVLFFGVIALRCFGQTSPSPVPPPQAAGYSLSFADEFDSLDLSPNGSGSYKWYASLWWNPRIPDCSLMPTSNSVVSLIWKNDGTGSTNTSITTFAHDKSQGRTWRFGYFEARMKWDVVRGAWPAFWLMPIQDATGADTQNGVKEHGEIDVFEGQGDYPNTFFGTIHDWKNNQSTANNPNWYNLPVGFNFAAFHTYGILWVPGRVTWYVDDVVAYSAPTPAVVDVEDFFIVLGSQEGANWTHGSMAGVDAQKINLDVDWVRVWQK